MRVLITGASGLVGANLTRLLLAEGHAVRTLVHDDDRGLAGLEVERVRGDVRDPGAMRAAVRGMDAVVHLVAVIAIERDPDPLLDQVNVQGVAHVVEACLAEGVGRLVHTSSIHALARAPADAPFHEERSLALEPTAHPYDSSKARGEQTVLDGVARGLDAVVLTPVGIFGPHDHVPSPTGEMLVQLAHRQIPALVDAGFYWVDARDVAQACAAALTRGQAGQRYILHSEYATTAQIGAWAAEASGVPAPRLVAPMWLAAASAPAAKALAQLAGRRPLYTPASLDILRHHQRIETDKARRELGFAPRPVRQSIHDAVAWFMEHGAIRGRA